MNDFFHIYKKQKALLRAGGQYRQKMVMAASPYSDFLVPVPLVSQTTGSVYIHTDRV